MAGKGRKPEGGVNWERFYDGMDRIDWRRTVTCEKCNGRGLVEDPQHGHAFKCEKCNGEGKYKEGKEPVGSSKSDNQGSEA